MLRLGVEITIPMLEWAAVVGRLYNCHVANCSVAVKFKFEVPSTGRRCARLMLTDYTGQQNLTFFLSHEEKYLILIVLLTLNSNMQVVFLHHPRFFCDSQVKWGKMCIFTYFTGKQNLTFFGTRRKISVPNRTFNAEFKYVSSFSPSPTVFVL
jgi:hypothetical protein